MSVNYSAKYGKGFMISWDELEKMSDTERDVLLDSVYIHWICGYSDTPPLFFGIVAADIDCDDTGYYMISADEIDFDKDEVNKMVDELKRLMPNKDHFIPRRFVLGCCS